MSLYRDEGVVLRTQKLGEADRIVTLLTRGNGRIRAAAKGVRRTSSRFGARLEPFMHVDVQFATGRTLDVVTQVETVAPLGRSICADYACYTAGTAILETAERLSAEEREPAVQQYQLLVGALRALAEDQHDPGLVLDAYLLRGLAIAGFAPSFTDCARCSDPGPHRLFSVQAGGMVCMTCRPAGTVAPSMGAVALLGALLAGEWAVADASETRARREASGITAAFLQWHLERGLRSLPLVERRSDVRVEQAGDVRAVQPGDVRVEQPGDERAEQSGDERAEARGDARLNNDDRVRLEQHGAEAV